MDNKTTYMSPFIHPFQFCRMGAMSNKMTRSPSQKQIPQPLPKQIMKRVIISAFRILQTMQFV